MGNGTRYARNGAGIQSHHMRTVLCPAGRLLARMDRRRASVTAIGETAETGGRA